MQPLAVYLSSCLARKLLETSPIAGVYWSTSISRKLAEARKRGTTLLTLGLGDFLVSDYSTLSAAKRAVHAITPGAWAGTEIHHIVENFHLQFLGVVSPVTEQTYLREEPCVLMAKKHHDTHVDNIVGGAETLIMETKPFDFVGAFRDANPGISVMNRTAQGALRAAWVKTEEAGTPPRIRRIEIRDTLLEIYSFAYQEPELEPLRLIAQAVIRGMPL